SHFCLLACLLAGGDFGQPRLFLFRCNGSAKTISLRPGPGALALANFIFQSPLLGFGPGALKHFGFVRLTLRSHSPSGLGPLGSHSNSLGAASLLPCCELCSALIGRLLLCNSARLGFGLGARRHLGLLRRLLSACSPFGFRLLRFGYGSRLHLGMRLRLL